MGQILGQLREVVLAENRGSSEVESAAALVAKQSGDGSWPDIDYAGKRDMQWEPSAHATRIQNLAVAYCTPGSPCFGHPPVAAAIHRALGYWREARIVGPNWWWNEIGVPMRLGTAMMLLRAQLTPEELAQCRDIRDRKTINRAGQNGVWAAGVDLLFALALDDEATLQKAIRTIFDHVAVPKTEGLQTDFAFHQHGPQQQFGYGVGFANDTIRLMEILRNTGFQVGMTPEKLAVFSRYLRDGMAQVLWKGNMDIIALGRGIYPDKPPGEQPLGSGRGPRDAATCVVKLLDRMPPLDPSHADEYRRLVAFNRDGAPNPLIGNKLFFRSDQMVHRRPEFSLSLKASSVRTTATECSGTENRQGQYLGDGTTFLFRSGGEYSDIYPVWDWRKLPGVTCGQSGPLPTKYAKYQGSTDFVGGVSDGASGCFAMDLNRGGVVARKAWFLAGDAIVCLGAGITGQGDHPVATTVNQCLRNGPVALWNRAGARAELASSACQTLADLQALEHDGVRYLFPEDARITVSSAHRKAPWDCVTDYGPSSSLPIEKDVLTVWFDHGAKPANASYCYVLLPAIGRAEAGGAKTFEAAGISIVKNTADCQAVFFHDAKILQMVFYKEGGVKTPSGTSVSVGSPCAVLVNSDRSPCAVWVADPTGKLPNVTVVVNGVTACSSLPQGAESGRPVALNAK